MVYRNAPHVNGLYRRSSEWRGVVRAKEYMAFDEWWGAAVTDDMAEVVRREGCAQRGANAQCHTRTHTRTHAHTRTRTLIRTHTHAHTHTRTHTHTYTGALFSIRVLPTNSNQLV